MKQPTYAGYSSRSAYGGHVASSCGTSRDGLYVGIGSGRPSYSRFGFGCTTFGSYKRHCYEPYGYRGCYSPYAYPYQSGFRLGFGFYTAPVVYPVYPIYPAYPTIYEPYPVYATAYEPYPVYTSSPAYVSASATPSDEVLAGTYVDQRRGAAVIEDQTPAGYPQVDSQRDAGLVLREQALRESGIAAGALPSSTTPSSATTAATDPAAATQKLENGARVADIPGPDDSAGSGVLPDDEMNRLMKEGVEAFAAAEYEQAAERFLRVAMADPNNVDATLAYATSRFGTGDYPMAAIAIRRGVRRTPDVVNALFDLRDRYSQMAHFDRQLMVLTDWLKEHPDDIDALVTLGFVQHFTAQRAPAAETFKHLKDISQADADLADVFLNAKSIEELQKLAAEQQQSAPTSAPAASE